MSRPTHSSSSSRVISGTSPSPEALADLAARAAEAQLALDMATMQAMASAEALAGARAAQAALVAEQQAARQAEETRLAELARATQEAEARLAAAQEEERRIAQAREDAEAAVLAAAAAEERQRVARAEEAARQQALAKEAERRAEVEAERRAAEEAARLEQDRAAQQRAAEAQAEEDRREQVQRDTAEEAATEREAGIQADAARQATEQERRAREAEQQAQIQAQAEAQQPEAEQAAEEARQTRLAAEESQAAAAAEQRAAEVRLQQMQQEATAVEALRAEAMAREAEQARAAQDAATAEQERAAALEAENRKVVLAREEAARDLARQREAGVKVAETGQQLEEAVRAQTAEAVLHGYGIAAAGEWRDQLLATDRFEHGDSNPAIDAAIADHLDPGPTASFVAREIRLTEEVAGEQMLEIVEFDELVETDGVTVSGQEWLAVSGRFDDLSQPAFVTLLPDPAEDLSVIAVDTAVHEMDEQLETRHEIGELMEDVVEEREAGHHEQTARPHAELHVSGVAQPVDRQEVTASVGIPGEAPGPYQPEPLPGGEMCLAVPVAAALAMKAGAEMWQQGQAWLEERFGQRESESDAGLSPQAGEAGLLAPGMTAERIAPPWVAPDLQGPPASAQERHEAFFVDSPELGTMAPDGHTAEQARAEAGMQEWQAFRQEQAALQAGIAQALDRGDQARADMLTLRMQLEGTDFAAQTAAEVHSIASATHGAGSTQAIEAQMRAETWAERHEACENLWAVNAVRSDLYQPTTPAMAEAVSEWREREQGADLAFEATSRGMPAGERETAREQHQERKDRELHEAFSVPAMAHGIDAGAPSFGP